MTLLDPTNLRRLTLKVKCFDATVPKVQFCLEIGTWVIRMRASESDSMVGKGIGLETKIVLWS